MLNSLIVCFTSNCYVMQVFTSNFKKARSLDSSRYCVVSIARRSPRALDCVRCSSLAPSAELLRSYHDGLSPESYAARYREEISNLFDLHAVFESLVPFCKGRDMVLCCYESDGKFCHRHILSDIVFERFGYRIQELSC